MLLQTRFSIPPPTIGKVRLPGARRLVPGTFWLCAAQVIGAQRPSRF